MTVRPDFLLWRLASVILSEAKDRF